MNINNRQYLQKPVPEQTTPSEDNKPLKKPWPPTMIGFGALGVVIGSMIGSTEVAVGGMVVGGALGKAIDVYVDSRTKKSTPQR